MPLISQLARDWQLDYIGTLPLSEASRYALVCVDILSGLTQAFSCACRNQGEAPPQGQRTRPILVFSEHILKHYVIWFCKVS